MASERATSVEAVERRLVEILDAFHGSVTTAPISSGVETKLLQLRVLGLGLLQNGDVGVSVFPQREEILIGCLGFEGCPG